MNNAIPTPFDIIPPPPGPWVPSGYAWILLLFLLSLLWILIRRVGRRRGSPAVEQIVRGIEVELSHAALQNPIPLERVCRLTKRLISFFIPHDLSGLTAPETRAMALALSKGDERMRSAAEIVDLLASIEEQEYAPRKISPDSSLNSNINKLTTAIAAHTRRYKPS